ncbi:hypothetical protein Bsph_p081 (plasmid) [Lysinibacillus sphaericus C3-41]|uniref:Uncharacterized protein n=1 Tax=Lysinibacillus sphaericus (strain C3-41) TaxID=444177 RepID=B1I0F2_LYSSC|nr:hypothetical protein Bsph_p081 [Lysinibacillus sphaericus C3-41]
MFARKKKILFIVLIKIELVNFSRVNVAAKYEDAQYEGFKQPE